MLEKNPTLTVREAEKILINNARQDQYTGNFTTPPWGYGKLDAYAAVKNTPCFDTIGINTISDTAICQGDSVVLKTKGGESHNWTSGGGLSCTNCQNPVAKPTGNTTYIVNGITKNGCKAGDTVQVTVNPNPAANAGSNATICNGEKATLNASGGTSYQWQPSSSLNCDTCATVKASPTNNQTYKLTAINQNGCSDTDSVKVEVNSLPTASSSSDTSLCKGNSVQLNASGGNSYSWTPAAGLSCTGCANPKAQPVTTRAYQVIAENKAGCKDTASTKVTINEKPTATVSGDESICEGGQIPISASGGSNYSWFPSRGLSCTDCPEPTASPLASTTYNAVVANQNGCRDTASLKVTVEPSPTVNPGTDKTICEGDSTQLKATGGKTYAWSPAQNLSCDDCASPIAKPLSTTDYRVVAGNSGNCTDTGFVEVTVNSSPTANAGADQTICEQDSVVLNATGGNSYEWQPATGLSCDDCQSPTASPANTTEYTLIASNQEGCKDKDAVLVEVEDCNSGLANQASQEGFQVYPNPNDGTFTISIAEQAARTVGLRLQTLKGRTLHRFTLIPDQSTFEKEINLSNISSGIYNLQLITEHKVLNKKITIY
jgi:hypothetical protein